MLKVAPSVSKSFSLICLAFYVQGSLFECRGNILKIRLSVWVLPWKHSTHVFPDRVDLPHILPLCDYHVYMPGAYSCQSEMDAKAVSDSSIHKFPQFVPASFILSPAFLLSFFIYTSMFFLISQLGWKKWAANNWVCTLYIRPLEPSRLYSRKHDSALCRCMFKTSAPVIWTRNLY